MVNTNLMNPTLHTFHIPVMGLAYTIDSPIKVARYGISSVISIIEDNLIELMRKHYYQQLNLPFFPITNKEKDYRARRITDYLNLVNRIVKEQIDRLKHSAFEAGSEISTYFGMLPESNFLKKMYHLMTQTNNVSEKDTLEKFLRNQVRPGSIDVNIMTKVDKNNYDGEGNLLADGSDAVAALRGYIASDLSNSSVIFSAGMNPRLFNYLEKTTAFDAKGIDEFDKKIVIKVSDYRSAAIQGKYLAKKGIWVSEFRIESGLNCGGHAFAGEGQLLGPILEEFKSKKEELIHELFCLYRPALEAKGKLTFSQPHTIRLTAQGGIGTSEEADFLRHYYGIDSVGWGTPFLLCPEATTVDDPTLELLSAATRNDVVLSRNSPLNIRFNYLKGSSAEKEKLQRIAKGKPGSPCTEKFLVTNTEFTKEPICTASRVYQKNKIEQLRSLTLDPEEYQKQYEEVVSKECLCIGLSNAAITKYGLPPIKKLKAVTICPGPNIAYFDKIVSLKEMVDHVYGRTNILSKSEERPHVFIKELMLAVNYLKEKIAEGLSTKPVKETEVIHKNIQSGIEYYRNIAEALYLEKIDLKNIFLSTLKAIEYKLNELSKTFSYTYYKA